MKRKSTRSIPDFSHKRPGSAQPQDPKQKVAAPHRPAPAVKPQATSMKSGRRGQ